ncbi:MAG TPA: OsmC family protein [Dehalococcoidia bacterium]|nr:OsmC family protein [Dehalococcoidia bacterium]
MADVETTLHLKDGLTFEAATPSGFRLLVDSAITPSDDLTGPTPMELQLVAFGGCTAMDTISILRKMRQDVTSYDVRLTHTRAPEHPKVYTSIQLTHAVRGRDLSEPNVRRAIELTMARYCPVFAMLHPTVDITERYELVDDSTGAVTDGDVPVPEFVSPAAG